MTERSEKNLLAKLHLKFTALICGVAFLILALAFCFVVWSTNNQKIEAIYTELGVALENVDAKNPRESSGSASDWLDESLDRMFSFSFDYSDTNPPRIGGKKQTTWAFPIALYTARIGSGNEASLSILSESSTAVVDETTLQNVLPEILSSASEQGFLKDAGLYYRTTMRDTGTLIIAFADQSAAGDSNSLTKLLLIVGLCIMLLVFALAWLFSRWALRPVQRAWDSQQQFIADASHEMKTPLTVIMANASIALKKPQATIAEQSQWIEGIQEEAQNMEQLVLDMLALAQPENAVSQDPASENVSVSELAERASLQFEAVAFERGLLLEENIERNVTVRGNTPQLQRMIGTLVDNACKYAQKGTAISLSLKTAGHECILSVHNWGDPIAPEDIPHVFDRFYRSDKSRDRSGEDGSHSFGLGLAIAQKIVQQHGGNLSVTSTQEEGTTFTATLPCVKA